jgi:urease beta subunit
VSGVPGAIVGGSHFDGAAGPAAPEGADAVSVEVWNRGDRPIQVASHYHLFEANPALLLDRRSVYGRRLDIPAGAAVRFEPGERRTVTAVRYRGARVVRGFLGAVDGPLDADGTLEKAVARLRAHGVEVPEP